MTRGAGGPGVKKLEGLGALFGGDCSRFRFQAESDAVSAGSSIGFLANTEDGLTGLGLERGVPSVCSRFESIAGVTGSPNRAMGVGILAFF